MAHTLKGIAGSIGAKELAVATRNLEVLLDNGESCIAQLKLVQNELKKVLGDIHRLSPEEAAELQETEIERLHGFEIESRLSLLQEKVSMSDTESEEILEEIQQDVNEQLSRKLDPIRVALARYDFEQSGQLLERLIQEVAVNHE